MTTTFAVDENNDLYIGADGNLAIISGIEAVLQACAQTAKAQLDEMILNVNRGIPNFQTIWNGSPNPAQFEAALRKAILAVQDVTSILNLETTIADNVLRYTVTIQTIYGSGAVNG